MADPRKTIDARSQEDALKSQDNELMIRQCFDRVASTADGLFLLQHFFKSSGHGANHLVMTETKDISALGMAAAEGRATLWGDLRRYFSRKNLIEIEHPETKG